MEDRESRRPEAEANRSAEIELAREAYLRPIVQGLGVTARHMAGVAFGNQAITMQYPEEQHVPSPNYRGVHRLNKDE